MTIAGRSLVLALVLLMSACSGSPAETSTTTSAAEPNSTTTVDSTATSTTAAAATTTSTTVSNAPSTEAWDTWTLILASIEAGEPDAEDQAGEIAAGVTGAGVLFSGDYPSLNPGYWVVYKGEYPSGREASNRCGEVPDELTCYPRYLGPDVSPLATDGHALAIDGESLVIVDVATGERRKIIDPFFSGDGRWVSRMSLDPVGEVLYYDVGWEDSWYSCESSQGQVEMLRLGFGTTTAVAPGFSPSVSPDGKWLALLVAGQCLPDPAEPDFWVLTPPDTVVLYSLASDTPQEVRRWRTAILPSSYEDPNMVTWVDWRADSQALVVANYAGDLIEVPLDHQGQLFTGALLLTGVAGSPRALLGDTLYVVRDDTPEEWGGFDILAVDLPTGAEGEVITQTVGWPVVTADTTRTRLIWGADTQIGTAESQFGLETYLGSLAW